MNKKSWLRDLISQSDNRKLKTCTAFDKLRLRACRGELSRSIQNRKSVGLLLIFLLLMGHVGMAAAQQPASKLRRIGYLTQASGPGAGYEMFRQELRNLGYVEGRNVAIEYRSAETRPHLDKLV